MMSIEKLNEIKDRAKPELLKRLELEDNTIITDDEIKLKGKYYEKQVRIALKNCKIIDPLNIEEYIALDGYLSLANILSNMTQQEVIDVVKDSGLRGRGGAGFPAGRKWEEAYKLCTFGQQNKG